VLLDQLADLRRKLIEKQFSLRRVMGTIQDVLQQKKEEKESKIAKEVEAIRAAQENFKHWQAKSDIVKNVLQGLILQSGRDWSEDDHLVKILLSCSDEPF